MQGIMRRVPKTDRGNFARNPATRSALNAAIFGPRIPFLADSRQWQARETLVKKIKMIKKETGAKYFATAPDENVSCTRGPLPDPPPLRATVGEG